MGVKLWVRQSRKKAFSIVVLPRAIIPAPAIWWLKLNTAQSVERPFFCGWRAEDQNARLMIRCAGNMPHFEDEPVIAIFLFRVKNTTPCAKARHRTLLDRPCGGDVSGI